MLQTNVSEFQIGRSLPLLALLGPSGRGAVLPGIFLPLYDDDDNRTVYSDDIDYTV